MTTRSHGMEKMASDLATTWLGHPTFILDTVHSTNRWLKEKWVQKAVDHGTVVWADAQTDGRGRLGRSWDSPPGENIYTSLLITPPADRVGGILSLLTGVAVVEVVRAKTGLDARMKWPNDGVVLGRKFCGILVEAGMSPRPWAIVGIGINVCGTVDQSESHRITLERAAGRPLNRADLWISVLNRFEQVYEAWLSHGDHWVVQAWTSINATLGQMVRIERPGARPWIGMAESLDDDGGLWVSAPHRREKVISGEVRLRSADGRYAPDSF